MSSQPYVVSGFSRTNRTSRTVDTVVKVGGSLLANTTQLDAVLETIALVARDRRLLVVPGGGPFADVVRDVDRRIGLPDTAAHWMAVLGMDQYGHLLASRLKTGMLICDPGVITATYDRGRVPVLAPSRWVREADPLPHSWEVTSDSIAAWVAGAVAAARLVLVKPTSLADVDSYFARALPDGVQHIIVGADHVEDLRLALSNDKPRSMTAAGTSSSG
jgi:aspartokinase-like uncharacterized kinase